MADCTDRFFTTSKDLKIVLERVYNALTVVESGVVYLEDLRLVILIVRHMSLMWAAHGAHTHPP